MFKFKGISSNDMQVVIEEEEHFIARASQRYEVTEIEGRDAAIFDELGYSVVERPIYVQCLNPRKIDDILAWLNGEGVFEYKGRKTTARFYSQLEPQRSSCIKIIDTTFIRDPFWNKANEEFQIAKDRKDKKASGEYIHVEDSSNCRAKIKISGNSEQETRSGKNNLENSDNNVSQYGLTATIQNDGSIKISGTSTTETVKYLTNIKKVSADLIKEGNYTMSFKNSENMSDVSVRLRKYNGTDRTEIKNIYLNAINKSEILNLKSLIDTDTIEIELDVICYGNREYNFVLYPQLELGSETEYEQFGVSPSPDYPSEIEVVGSNVNLFAGGDTVTNNGVTFTKNKDDSYDIVGMATEQANCINFVDIQNSGIINGNIYNIHVNENLPDGVKILIEAYNDTAWIRHVLGSSLIPNVSKANIENANKIRFTLRVEKGISVNIHNLRIKLEKDTIETAYSKYGQGCITEVISNKNLIDLSKCQVKTLNGVTSTYNKENNSITFNGTCTSNNTVFNIIMGTVKTFKNNTTLTVKLISGSATGYAMTRCYDTNWEKNLIIDLSQLNSNKSLVSKTYNDINDVFEHFDFRFNSGAVLNNFTVQLMLTNKVDTDYIQHQEQSYIIPTQQPMRSVEDTRDTFIKKNNKWYERHYIARKIFDGTEDWRIYSNAIKLGLFTIKIDDIKSNEDAYAIPDITCTHFQKKSLNNTWLGKEGISVGSKQIRIFCPTKDTVEKWKTYLVTQYNAETPVYVDYILQTPTDIECTEKQSKILDELSNARTYKNVTNITTDSKAILSLDYFAVTDEKIKNEGNIQSRPLLRLEKTVSEAVELTINNVRFKYNFKNEEYVEIDCENKEVKFEGLNRFRNIEIGYEFPKLNVGENKIVMHSGDCIIKVLRKDRWL